MRSKLPNLPLFVMAALGAGLASGLISTHVEAQIAVRNQGYVPFSEAPINYRDDTDDPVARLQHRLDAGEASLEWEPVNGYLQSVLRLLKVSVSSQMLVFSKTSFQYKKIAPETPRALYFNDDVYVGKVHDGKAIELVSFDAKQGAIFYLLDEPAVEKPVFQRAELDCTTCHVAAGTRNVPGVLVRSIYPTALGTQAQRTPSFLSGNQSPLAERFGGWYVTGTTGNQRHMGNAVSRDHEHPGVLDQGGAASLSDLSGRIDTSRYLTPYSDIVAQLVQAHQTQAHNLITLTSYRTRIALYEEAQRKGAGRADAALTEAAAARYYAHAEELVRYLIFADEAPLDAAVRGTSGFAEQFARQGPRDRHGRSLREFDLETRLFKYPVSYLIYTDAFDALPEPAKGYVYHRLFEVLNSTDDSDEFTYFKTADRRAALDILRETRKGLPAEWQPPTTASRAAARSHATRQ